MRYDPDSRNAQAEWAREFSLTDLKDLMMTWDAAWVEVEEAQVVECGWEPTPNNSANKGELLSAAFYEGVGCSDEAQW